jgi:autotransporter-associated beta strand protein
MRTALVGVAILVAAAASLNAAVSTWNGNGSILYQWTNSSNWSPGMPGVGDDAIIADTTGSTNGMVITNVNPIIGSFTFGTTGTRTANFFIQPSTNVMTITNGFVANGNFATGSQLEFFHMPITISGDQTWSVGGAAGNSTTDAGIRLRELRGGVANALTLNGTLTKAGSGQLSFVGQTVGSGNIIVNAGSLKLNAGGSTPLTLNGTGSITVNANAILMTSRNSGTFSFTKTVVLNGAATLQIGGGTATTVYGCPITWNGPVTWSTVTTGSESNVFTGAWTGNATITVQQAGSNPAYFTLSNNISGLSGSINHAANSVRIRLSPVAPGNAAIAWSLNNSGATLECFGAANVALGSLGGSAGTLRNSDPALQPATVTVGALNSTASFGGLLADNTAALGLTKVGSGTLTLTANNTYSGGTLISGGTLALQGATASTGSGSVTVQSGATFAGSGTATTVSVQAGGTLEADGGGGAPPLTVNSLAFGVGATDETTTKVNVYLGGKIANTGPLTVNGTNTINILGAAPAVGVYDLITYSGAIGGSGFAGFQLGSLPFGVVANLQDSGTAVQLNVTAVTIEPGIWVGNVLSQWNLAGGLEWKGATSGNPQPYHDLDVVTFDDSAASFAVNITANVNPGSVLVTNSTPYTFSGGGSIVGGAFVAKDGAGPLTIVNSNVYAGGTFITNGTLLLGDGGVSGSIAGNVLDDGSLVFNRSDSNYFSGIISGTGSVEQRGSGITAVSGANAYTGATTVSGGTLAAGSGTALGDIAGATTVANGATLDVNGQNLGAEPVTVQGAGVGGAGAIVNNGVADQLNALRYVTLSGPSTFGGLHRWDIREPTPFSPNGGSGATLTGNGNNLVKSGSNIVAFINLGDTGLSDVAIQAGTLTFSRSTFMGDSSRKITVSPGATLQLHRTSEFINNVLNKVVAITNGIMAIESSGLTNQFAGPISLGGSNLFSLPAATGLNLQGTVGGDGSVTTVGTGLLVVSGTCNYSGGTTLGGGVLEVDGSLGTGGHPLLINGPTTVMGDGVILDPVTIPSGSSLAPGDSIGRLTVSSSLVLAAGSTNIFEINKDLATNDIVAGMSSVTYGGTLVLNNVGSSTYAPGDNFKLFDASSYSGLFAAFVPATPGPGLIWVTNNLTVNGTISVAVLPNPVPLLALSASSLVSTNLNVIFSAALDQGSAETAGNYQLSTPNNILTATRVTPTNVLLLLDSPLTVSSYTLNVKNVKDLAYIPNVVATTNVPAIALGFLQSFSILVTNGSAFAYGTNSTNQIKIYSDGADIFGTQDHFQYVYEYLTGDFDLSVRLESLLETDPAAKAGIMVRDVVDPTFPLFDDRHYMAGAFTVDPTRNNNFVQYREASGATAIAPGAPRPAANYPNNWLRVKRSSSVLRGFVSPNGLDWTEMTAVDSATNAAGAYPASVRVGLAVTAHNAAATTEAIFSAFGKARERQNLTWVVSGGTLTLNWSSPGPTLQATPDITPPATWTNVPGSTSVNLLSVPIGSGQLFYRLSNQ